MIDVNDTNRRMFTLIPLLQSDLDFDLYDHSDSTSIDTKNVITRHYDFF